MPTVVFSIDVDKSADLILHRNVSWHEKVKVIDEVSPLGNEKILNALVTVYYDSSLHYGCPSILYHTVNGLRFYKGNKKALGVVRDGIHYNEPEIRMISLEVLGVIGSEEDIDILRPFLMSSRPFESHYAEIAVKNIKDRAQRSAL